MPWKNFSEFLIFLHEPQLTPCLKTVVIAVKEPKDLSAKLGKTALVMNS